MSGWRDDAACRGEDTRRWFPTYETDARPAIRVCESCPVIDECRAEIESTPRGQRHGVWAGKLWTERLPKQPRPPRVVTCRECGTVFDRTGPGALPSLCAACRTTRCPTCGVEFVRRKVTQVACCEFCTRTWSKVQKIRAERGA